MHWLKITSLSIVSFGFCILLILGLLIFTGKMSLFFLNGKINCC